MDTVVTLLRTVVRGFYSLPSIIVLEAILTHHVLSDRELAQATGIGIKEVRAACAKLRDDHLLKEISHRDESGPRAFTQTVYFIRFPEAVDAVKWKMHGVETKLRQELDQRHNAQDYVCDTCGRHYETIDALALFDPETQQFLCDFCGSALRESDPKVPDQGGAGEDEEVEDDRVATADNAGAEDGNQMETFMTQLRSVLVALKTIDETTIPDNTLQDELQKHVPLDGPDVTGPLAYNLPPHLAGPASTGAAAGDGLTIAGSSSSLLPQKMDQTFQINITSDAEQRSIQAAAEREKQRLAEENALPEWHSQSTVSTGIEKAAAEVKPAKGSAQSSSAEAKSDAAPAGNESAMDAYFRRLQEEQPANEEDEDEEDEFEDVM